jgi:hypothetical protein
MTNSEIVSKITNGLKSVNRDGRYSRRYILSVLRGINTNLLSQKLLDRTIQEELQLYTTIKCFEFEKTDVISCPMIEFSRCTTLMRSKHPLPKLLFSRIGSSIKRVESIDGGTQLTILPYQQFSRNKKRQFQLKGEHNIYLGIDNHLYTEEEIYTINVDVLTIYPEDADKISGCGNSGSCKSGWDYEFITSDKIQDTVYNQALQIISATKNIREDENPNNVNGK